MPKLQVTAGSSFSALSTVAVNKDTQPLKISNNHFEGSLTVRIKDFKGQDNEVVSDSESGYFQQHSGLTWSIQLQGRFKQDQLMDDVVFGNIFDHPIRDSLPYGTALALKFVNFIDPALEQDIYADKPWAWSPLISTMNRIAFHPSSSSEIPWNSSQAEEDITPLYSTSGKKEDVEYLKGNSDARRKYFANKTNRDGVIPKDTVFETDFCNGFIDFNTLSVNFGARLQFSLAKYWDGQPVRYICRTRDGSKIFFCIDFTLVDAEGLSDKTAMTPNSTTDEENKDDLGVD